MSNSNQVNVWPRFSDHNYLKSSKVYFTDRILAATLLKLLPSWITPNELTLLRVFLTPFVIFFLAIPAYNIGLPLFLFAALTDALDGALARTTHRITPWGMIFDPVADKFLIISSVLLLIFRHLNAWLAVALITVELLIVVAALIWRRQGLTIQSNIWGKIKMLLQVFGITCILLIIWFGWPLQQVATISLLSSVVFACISLLRYGL